MSINWDLIDKVIYINLKDRVDRKKRIKTELQFLGIPEDKIVRLNATYHMVAQIGCAQSHMNAMTMAINERWGNVLVVEDDMVFNRDDESQARMHYFLNALGHVEWDAALLSANYFKVKTLKSTSRIVKPVQALCACAYLVHANYLHTLREVFSQSVERLLKGGHKYDHAVDVAWLPVMARDRWLGIYPVAGHQAPGYSDIEKRVMDYTEHFYKDLAAISASGG
ncbi:glycosyl hydrolase family 25 [Lelliottia nimipressuralis]|uniref:glycosyl hydrolase family 25 n=1 Tax=Lelliottia nimipressuralis TaxID=69220 RepID=UPI0028976536|nr:glycosyl hydrolase family 25 [Lelliottia nimipressuralis]